MVGALQALGIFNKLKKTDLHFVGELVAFLFEYRDWIIKTDLKISNDRAKFISKVNDLELIINRLGFTVADLTEELKPEKKEEDDHDAKEKNTQDDHEAIQSDH